MAVRTIAEIRAEMIAAKDTYPELGSLSLVSLVAQSRLWIYVVSVVVWTLENIIDIAITDQTNAIKAQKIHSYTWYSDMAKLFQFGYSLPVGEVAYDNTGIDEALIEASKKVKFASVTKVVGGLKMKIAGLTAGELAPITASEFTAFKSYIERVKAAGDNIQYTNELADHLKLELTIHYDPLVLNADGERLDGTNDTPVQDAISDYIKGIDFNTKFIPTFLIDALQGVDGVELPVLELAQSKYGGLAFTDIADDGLIPNSGYVRIYNTSDLTLNFEPWL